MNKQTLIYSLIGVVVLFVVAGFVVDSQSKNSLSDSESMERMESNTPASNESAMMENKMMDDKSMTDKSSDAMMMDNEQHGSYKDYSTQTLEAEHKAGKKVVLFFHAPWCPLCKASDSVFNSKTSELPTGVTVLKTDYDSNTELRTKYGVTYQHTFVQVDAAGKQITKWNGGDIDNVIKYVK